MTQEWLEDLREFLYEMMEPFIEDDDFREALLDEEQMPIWAAAFTHDTFDPNNNYEELEEIGDRMIEAAFPLYMMAKYKGKRHLTKRELTLSKNNYMSEKMQIERGQKYGFSKYLRAASFINLTDKVNEDLYESFIGALYLTGDNVIMQEKNKKKPRFDLITNDSFRLVRRFIAYDLKNVDNEDVFDTPAKTMIVQSLRRIGVVFPKAEILESFIPNNPKSAVDLSGKGIITLTPIMASIVANRLREDGIFKRIPTMIGTAFGKNKKDAISNAYADAKKNMEELGFTEEWSKEKRKVLQWKNQDPMLVERARKKARNEGYEDLEVYNVRSTGRADQIVQLSGINPTGARGAVGEKRTLVASGSGPDETSALTSALNDFLAAPAKKSGYAV